MSASALENEDLENVPLVRMEDVQPSRTYEVSLSSRRRSNEEIIETCVIEDIEYDNECIVNDDDDSNIGSMVSIQSEEVGDSEAEMIVPEPLVNNVSQIPAATESNEYNCGVEIELVDRKAPSSWPTLEILPGGVIKRPDKSDVIYPIDSEKNEVEMMYACAKCSESFKYLFCLVKHVKWHEDEAKKLKAVAEPTSAVQSNNYVCIHTNKRKMMMCIKSHKNKKKSPKKLKL